MIMMLSVIIVAYVLYPYCVACSYYYYYVVCVSYASSSHVVSYVYVSCLAYSLYDYFQWVCSYVCSSCYHYVSSA